MPVAAILATVSTYKHLSNMSTVRIYWAVLYVCRNKTQLLLVSFRTANSRGVNSVLARGAAILDLEVRVSDTRPDFLSYNSDFMQRSS